jgi:SAM-dependent methyltransferase
MSPTDSMLDEHYLTVGRNTVDLILQVCMSSWLWRVDSVLDLPCGHGRVLRHLRSLFPAAELHACDMDEAGVAFCARQFGAKPIISRENPEEVVLPAKYDLIWVGSLFTHLPRPAISAWLKKLAEHLTDAGVIVATFHGRYSIKIGDTGTYIFPEAWAKIKADYNALGFGYADYNPDHQHATWIHGGYGVSLSDPALVIQDASAIPGVRIFNYLERGWAGHQDVLVLGRPAVDYA